MPRIFSGHGTMQRDWHPARPASLDPVRALDALTEAVEELRAAAGAPCPDAAVSYGLEGVVWAREQLAAAAALGIRLDPADIGPDGTIDGMDPGEWAAAMAME